MNLEPLFVRLLVGAWVLFWGVVLTLVLFPKLAARIANIGTLRPFFIFLAFVSIAYGIVWLYRQGMKTSKK